MTRPTVHHHWDLIGDACIIQNTVKTIKVLKANGGNMPPDDQVVKAMLAPNHLGLVAGTLDSLRE